MQQPWGPLLAFYFVAIGVPSGLTLAALWHRNRWPQHPGRVERWTIWTALAVLLVASVVLVVDLGRPAGFFLMLTRFDNLGSPIAIGAKIIAVKVFVLAVAAYLLRRRHGPGDVPLRPGNAAARVLDTAVVWLLGITSLALAVYPTAVLARAWFVPLADTSGAALIFLLTALLMGAAGLLTIHAIGPRTDGAEASRAEADGHGAAGDGDGSPGRADDGPPGGAGGGPRDGAEQVRRGVRAATLALLATYAVAIAFEGLAVRGNPAAEQALVAAMATTGGALAFWGLVVGVGLVAPAVGLVAAPARRWVQLGAAAAIVVGASAGRYLIFTVG